MFAAAILDMDGLMIDSEPLWRLAEKEVFHKVGILLTDADCEETTGVRIDAVVHHWLSRAGKSTLNAKQIECDIVDRVSILIRAQGAALAGLDALLALLRQHGLKIGLASSSPYLLINTVVSRLDLSLAFDVLHSAEDELAGKPDPAVYLTTARKLGVPAASCLAFEDSSVGLRAAQAAGMTVVAVPALAAFDHPSFDSAAEKLRSLTEFNADSLVRLAEALIR